MGSDFNVSQPRQDLRLFSPAVPVKLLVAFSQWLGRIEDDRRIADNKWLRLYQIPVRPLDTYENSVVPKPNAHQLMWKLPTHALPFCTVKVCH